jgi:TetR/AcrR family transcriptional regulator, regulator of autoinduction and epiphytic fitness
MTPNAKRRKYDASGRVRQAHATRRRIVEAAAELFVRDGYAATSIALIAEAAGVAVPTVYATLGSKANILHAVVDLTVRAGDEEVAVAARSDWHEMEAATDPHERLTRFARIHRGICDREAAVFEQLEAAAGSDPEATELLERHEERRYETQSRLARRLHRDGQLRPGLGAREAADLLWTLASERTYLALVRHRGWTPRRYERWVVDQLTAALLPR